MRSVMMVVQIYERSMISAVQMNQVYNISISASTGIQWKCGLPDD